VPMVFEQAIGHHLHPAEQRHFPNNNPQPLPILVVQDPLGPAGPRHHMIAKTSVFSVVVAQHPPPDWRSQPANLPIPQHRRPRLALQHFKPTHHRLILRFFNRLGSFFRAHINTPNAPINKAQQISCRTTYSGIFLIVDVGGVEGGSLWELSFCVAADDVDVVFEALVFLPVVAFKPEGGLERGFPMFHDGGEFFDPLRVLSG